MFITEELETYRQAVEKVMQNAGVFTKWETEDRGVRNLKGLGQKRLFEVKWFVPPRFLIMPGAFDAIYAFLMMYPIQPGLAFYVYHYLIQANEQEKASQIKNRFNMIGHIFPDKGDNDAGTTPKEPPTETSSG